MIGKINIEKSYNISIIFLVGLFIGSIVFYQQRMLFVDPAFITFEIINNKTFIFSEHRYGAFITQMFPLICVYLDAPLKLILIIYSASFYLFYLFVAIFSGSILRQKLLAILFIFYLCIFVTDVYFWPNNEIHQAVGWMILFMSLYNYSNERDFDINVFVHIGLFCTLFFSIISHLLVLIPLSFLWCYNLIDRPSKLKDYKMILIYTLLIILFGGLRYYLSHNSWYDGVKLQGVKQISLDSILYAFKNDHAVSMANLILTKYFLSIFIFLSGLMSLLYRKKLILAFLTVFYSISYFLLVTLTYSDKITESDLFYFESQWMGLSLIICVPFLFETIKNIKSSQIVTMFFLLIFLIKIPQLYGSLNKFRLRLTNLQSLVYEARRQETEKCYLINSEDMKEELLLTWGVPVESCLLSSLVFDETITIKTLDKSEIVSTSSDSIYTAFKFLPIEEINSIYFQFSKISKYEQLDR